ncbi:glucans biosynthesis glucosyltransferase MdoH [Bradyrhizobium sp. AUGA SZCCT0431]|uniref:glucans biosynthesis glucosyltransferase MdoH n=1 Tax=Bradyrhizobium sp. AUGA SZCCT0431 TaxID=2807674 RepID=UPI001BAAFAB6|nr:glucans biosynthesis glucosyltransferase MdoH [Bradyrhizobium sp. AUGA SZCCT0431]MBR1147790.1 glucans biosynthesis glucosyltransferase MdoH [Bradyrhizobium sp. AUGA SZCCT0431]
MDTLGKVHGSLQRSDRPFNQFLPREAPMDMALRPQQRLQPQAQAADFTTAWPRRACILAGTVLLTLAGCYEMYQVLQVGGVTILEWMILVLFVLLFAWIAFSFTSAIAGFFVLLFRRKDELGIDSSAALPAIESRTAMLLPTYNEDPYRVLARLRAICESVEETGYACQFDWFVLSDTTDPAIWIAEEKCFLQLRHEAGPAARIFYRHRPENTARKSGNIEDWVRRFGSDYECMLILDADSLMTGDTIVRLVAAMEQHRHVALIQTLPIVVNARTLFARWQQFAGRLYGPLIAAGIAWWHGSEGNYWGHNAIIRVSAFARYAALPELRGRKPFGGHILSHDFIEAAFMRRGGWAIHMAPTLGGSYEECPPSLLDFAARDRRWCQGNLQHLAVLPSRGLHWVSRLHLLTGIGSYLTAPLWFIFLGLGILVSLQAQFVRPEYFPKGFSLFPTWPAQDPILAAWVFVATMGMLILPKLLAYIVMLTHRDERRKFGGGFRVLAGIVAETFLSGLTAPVMMIFQSSAVGEILLGRDAGWQVQRRDDGAVSRKDTLRKYSVPTFFGVAMAISAYAVSLPLLLWMMPVILGLLLAIPLATLSSSASAGAASSLFRTPEETSPPQVLRRANELASASHRAVSCPLLELRRDPDLREAHLDNLSGPRPRNRGEVDPHLAIARAKIEDAETFDEAAAFLSPRETFAALHSPAVLGALLDLRQTTNEQRRD